MAENFERKAKDAGRKIAEKAAEFGRKIGRQAGKAAEWVKVKGRQAGNTIEEAGKYANKKMHDVTDD
jgi:hypothetical protein